jgi:hypothetical protein
MTRSTQWLSLFGGGVLLIYGLQKLYQEGDWVLVILAFLILAFTILNMVKTRRGNE